MSTGRLVAVVGPSGVGKDSVMRALVAARPEMHLVRRVITRPADAGGEDFESVGEAEFAEREKAGDFVLSWSAHGLRYGIPRAVEAIVAAGGDAVVNLSRAVLPEARARFPRTEVILLTADRATLARRLSDRGREDAAGIDRRLSRATFALPDGVPATEIDNTGTLDETVARIVALLMPAKV
ncbi:MAG: phosphonate metabolism protein/1,5-bisphosphokinase (PRPP-forming) PhnN [Pseudooceanicola sp.]